jgi:hypothetical protein
VVEIVVADRTDQRAVSRDAPRRGGDSERCERAVAGQRLLWVRTDIGKGDAIGCDGAAGQSKHAPAGNAHGKRPRITPVQRNPRVQNRQGGRVGSFVHRHWKLDRVGAEIDQRPAIGAGERRRVVRDSGWKMKQRVVGCAGQHFAGARK